jgi:cytochrome c oxidase subunit 3
MDTTITKTEGLVNTGIGGGRSPSGNGFRKNGSGDFGDRAPRSIADRYRIGVWVLMAGIVMLFTALASSYIVRAASDDWKPLSMPRALWLSSGLIVASSLALEFSRHALKQHRDGSYVRWLSGTTLLGIGFVASQLAAWRQLARQGVYLATNPHSSFFYLFTATHGVHLIGGLLALGYLLLNTGRPRETADRELRRVGAVQATAIYWHFLGVLWIGLFLLLFLWK